MDWTHYGSGAYREIFRGGVNFFVWISQKMGLEQQTSLNTPLLSVHVFTSSDRAMIMVIAEVWYTQDTVDQGCIV